MQDDLSQKDTWKYDIFGKCSEKMVFPKNCTRIWPFLYYQKNMMFFPPENMILFFRWKMKDNPSQKMHGNMIFSASVLKRWSFQKLALKYDLSLIIRNYDISISLKYDLILYFFTSN